MRIIITELSVQNHNKKYYGELVIRYNNLKTNYLICTAESTGLISRSAEEGSIISNLTSRKCQGAVPVAQGANASLPEVQFGHWIKNTVCHLHMTHQIVELLIILLLWVLNI